MNWEQVRGNWNQAKGELKKRWGKLTDDDFAQIGGERDKLIGRIQERYGYAKEEAERAVREWESRAK
ncbi:MAG: CsbD family protein [Rhodospirillales bacterium]|nr:CsbD family protein [Rhodospirillales bacterium]